MKKLLIVSAVVLSIVAVNPQSAHASVWSDFINFLRGTRPVQQIPAPEVNTTETADAAQGKVAVSLDVATPPAHTINVPASTEEVLLGRFAIKSPQDGSLQSLRLKLDITGMQIAQIASAAVGMTLKINNVSYRASNALSGGVLLFDNINAVFPANQTVTVDVYASISPKVYEASGFQASTLGVSFVGAENNPYMIGRDGVSIPVNPVTIAAPTLTILNKNSSRTPDVAGAGEVKTTQASGVSKVSNGSSVANPPTGTGNTVPVACPAGYTCTPGEPTSAQVSGCPSHYTCVATTTNTSASNCAINTYMTVGSIGEQVEKLQKKLISNGFAVTDPMGTYGDSTKQAVIKYQTSINIPATGFVGPITIEKLCSVTTNTTPVTESTLTASCFATPANPTVGQTVNWQVNQSGGGSPMTYTWTGTDGFTGSSGWAPKSYSTSGVKSATVTIKTPQQSVTKTCSITVGAPVVAAPTPRVVWPNGGETITAGNGGSLKWYGGGNGEKIKFELVNVATGATQWIVNDVVLQSNSAYYDGTVSWSSRSDTPAGSYKIRITRQADNVVLDESDAPFTIVAMAGTVGIIAPNSGTYKTGADMQFQWKTQNFTSSQTIDIKLVRITPTTIVPVATIGTGLQNTGSYSWKISANQTASDYSVAMCPTGQPEQCSYSGFITITTGSPSPTPSGTGPTSSAPRQGTVANVFYAIGDLFDSMYK